MLYDLWTTYEITERLASIFGKRLKDCGSWKVYRWLGRDHYLMSKNYKKE